MENTKGILFVRNRAQKVLFQKELQGQISDGMWENAKPHNHWKDWGTDDVQIGTDKFGRTFYANKDNYNISSKELLDCVGDRMLFAVIFDKYVTQFRGVTIDDLDICSIPEHHRDYEDAFKTKIVEGINGDTVEVWENGWMKYTREICKKYNLGPADFELMGSGIIKYDMADMRKDLNDLKVIFRNHLWRS